MKNKMSSKSRGEVVEDVDLSEHDPASYLKTNNMKSKVSNESRRGIVEDIDLSEHDAWPSWDPNLAKTSSHSKKNTEDYCDFEDEEGCSTEPIILEEEEESYYEEETVISAPDEHVDDDGWEPTPLKRQVPKVTPGRNTRSLSVFEGVLIEPESNPEHGRQIISPQRQDSGVYITIHRRIGDDDDDMTQITLDKCFDTSFYKKNDDSLNMIPEDDYTINNDKRRFSDAARGETMVKNPPWKHSLATSCLSDADIPKRRIREILWKDLSSKNSAVVQRAMEELQTVVIKSQNKSRSYMLIKSGVMAILGAMEGHPNSKGIQFLSCSILEQLASSDHQISRAIIELGGISMIERSLKKHADCQPLNEMCSMTLATLLLGK